jgi:hypothetical protein
MRVEKPRFKSRGDEGNYGPGYVGFSLRDNNLISLGICFFTQEEEKSIDVSHTFYVVDANTIIEAEAEGVIISDPKKYFDSPHIHVFFKKPRNLNPDYVQKMTEYAFTLVGKKYDYGLFLTFIYQWFVRKILRMDLPFKKQPPLLDNSNAFVCSEVSTNTLNQIPEYANLLPLAEWHPARISPLLLFSSEIFVPWKFVDDHTLTT